MHIILEMKIYLVRHTPCTLFCEFLNFEKDFAFYF